MSDVSPPISSSWKTILSLYLAMMAVGTGQTVVFAVLPMLGREMALHTLSFSLPFTDIVVRPGEMAITSLSALTALVFFLFAPSLEQWLLDGSTAWYRPHLIWLGVVVFVFISQRQDQPRHEP